MVKNKLIYLIDMVRNIDFISSEVKLRTFGQTRFKTVFGGIISIIIGVCIFVLSVYFMKRFWEREDFIVISNDDINEDNIDLNITDYPIQFTIVDDQGTPFDNSNKLFNFEGLYINEYSIENKLINTDTNNVDIDPCQLSDLGLYSTSFKNNSIPLNNFNCIKNNVQLQGTNQLGVNTSYLYISINYCVNNTNCLNLTQINEILNRSYLIISYLTMKVNNLDPNKPAYPYFSSVKIPININTYRHYSFKYRNITYQNDLAYVFYENLTKLFFVVDDYKIEDNKIKIDNSFASFDFVISNKSTYYKRSYLKFQDVLANVGGVLQCILFFTILCENYLSTKAVYYSLANEMINFHKIKDSPKKHLSITNRKKSFYEQNQNSQINNFLLDLEKLNKINEENNINNINDLNVSKTSDKRSHFKLDESLTKPEIKVLQSNIYKNNSSNISVKKEKNRLFHTQNEKKNLTNNNIPTISLAEFILERICIKKSTNVELLNKAENYINEKISIEFLIKKMNEMDKLKFTVLNQTQLKLFHAIPNPNFYEIFNHNSAEKFNCIDYLWRKYEFYIDDFEIEKQAYEELKKQAVNDDNNKRLINFTNNLF